jgi:hypothetical protein
VRSIEEIEQRIKSAEPKVEMIFLDAARDDQVNEHRAVAKQIGGSFCTDFTDEH